MSDRSYDIYYGFLWTASLVPLVVGALIAFRNWTIGGGRARVYASISLWFLFLLACDRVRVRWELFGPGDINELVSAIIVLSWVLSVWVYTGSSLLPILRRSIEEYRYERQRTRGSRQA